MCGSYELISFIPVPPGMKPLVGAMTSSLFLEGETEASRLQQGAGGSLGASSESVLGLGTGERKLRQSPLPFTNGEVMG